jgi:exodeoxyribonuclease VII large subunit
VYSRKQLLLQAEQKQKQLDYLSMRLLMQKKERYRHLKDSLDSINPKNLLTKGFCILFSEKNHSAITTIHSVKKQQKVEILLMDGKLNATINEIKAE